MGRMFFAVESEAITTRRRWAPNGRFFRVFGGFVSLRIGLFLRDFTGLLESYSRMWGDGARLSRQSADVGRQPISNRVKRDSGIHLCACHRGVFHSSWGLLERGTSL